MSRTTDDRRPAVSQNPEVTPHPSHRPRPDRDGSRRTFRRGDCLARGNCPPPSGPRAVNVGTTQHIWAVDGTSGTGVTAAIPVRGDPGITGGDGRELDGEILDTVRGSGHNEVSAFRMSASGGGWAAPWAGICTNGTLDVPSTATLAGGWLWAVIAHFGTPQPGLIPCWISRLSAL